MNGKYKQSHNDVMTLWELSILFAYIVFVADGTKDFEDERCILRIGMNTMLNNKRQ